LVPIIPTDLIQGLLAKYIIWKARKKYRRYCTFLKNIEALTQ